MKVKQLIEALLKADPELDVCTFSDQGVVRLSAHDHEVAVYEGEYETDNYPKLNVLYRCGQYVGLGNPANWDDLAPCDVVNPVKELVDFDDLED
jgi:hypothetical protein